jgi:multiple sugar transport system ATP-binding protein
VGGIGLDGVTKRYPNGVVAVDDVSLDVADGEFMVLVGPSGCGKSTLLRMIAGLEEVTDGTIVIDDRDVTRLEPRARDIAMVFQSYALYPHMSVEENCAFALRMRRRPRDEIGRRVATVATTLGLDRLLQRRPVALSGGQRQRVAIGRAMVREPRAFLMDEPLSNLDAKLRVSMRSELARMHARLGTTTVYVTHDQVEAMTLGDRVAVLRDGVLQQCDSPQRLFEAPVNLFVAAFIGSPQMNLVEAELVHGKAHFAGQQIELTAAERCVGDRRVILGVRPSDLSLSGADSNGRSLVSEASVVEELGSERHVLFAIDAPRVVTDATRAAADVAGEQTADRDDGTLLADDRRAIFTVVVTGRRRVATREPLRLAIDERGLHFFDPATGLALSAGDRRGDSG